MLHSVIHFSFLLRLSSSSSSSFCSDLAAHFRGPSDETPDCEACSTCLYSRSRRGLRALYHGNLVTQAERDSLCPRADADAARQLTVRKLFDRDIRKRVLSENGLRVEIHCNKGRTVDQFLDPDGFG